MTKETTMSSTEIITLDTPIKRGDTEITKITLHKPNSGALRGTSIRAILDMDTSTIITLLPRITDPQLTPAEASTMDLPDLVQAGVAVASFFLSKAALAEAKASI